MHNVDPDPITFLVLSDLHFGKYAVSQDFAPDDAPPPGIIANAVSMKQSLVEIVKDESIDAILISGDLTSEGSPLEFTECISTLIEIAEEIGLNKSKIIYTYGNHDVDWKISAIPDSIPSFSPCLKELYLKVGASVGHVVLPDLSYTKPGNLPGCGLVIGDQFRVFVANSGYYCSHDQCYSHGKLGAPQLEWLKKEFNENVDSDKWNILLLHHHPFNYTYPVPMEDISCIEEGADLMELIGNSGVDFVCHGHRHHPIFFTENRSGWRSPVSLLCAGSFSVNEQGRWRGEVPNVFHIVHLKNRLNDGTTVGQVKTFEYSSATGWQPIAPSARVPLDPIRSFAGIYSRQDIIADLEKIIKTSIGNGTDCTSELPDHQSLPLSLQCMSFHELNKYVEDILASQQTEYRLYGKYPDDVMIVKVK